MYFNSQIFKVREEGLKRSLQYFRSFTRTGGRGYFIDSFLCCLLLAISSTSILQSVRLQSSFLYNHQDAYKEKQGFNQTAISYCICPSIEDWFLPSRLLWKLDGQQFIHQIFKYLICVAIIYQLVKRIFLLLQF